MQEKYLFTSQRLGFRNWDTADIDAMVAINADVKVMEHFPSVLTKEQTADFISRMQKQFKEKGFCYFAVDILEGNIFIGFIGLSEPLFEADFTPCVDIGWRLSSAVWQHGFATEGAKRCLQYAFSTLKIAAVYAIAPIVNVKFEQVMRKIGMFKVCNFDHPLLLKIERLKVCVLYKAEPS